MNKSNDVTTSGKWQDGPCIEYLGKGKGDCRWRFKVCLASLDIMVAESSVVARIPEHLKHRSPTCHPIDIGGQLYVSEYEALMRIFLTGLTRELEHLRKDLQRAREKAMVTFLQGMTPIVAETQAMEDKALGLIAQARRGQVPN